MHEGVVRDVQRQEMKKIQNLKLLQDQIELTKRLEVQRDKEDARMKALESASKSG